MQLNMLEAMNIYVNVVEQGSFIRAAEVVVLLTCALFSGQLLAKQQDHAFVWFATGGHQLRHEADSDELRAAAEESAEGLREHHNWQKSRKPESYFR